MWQMKDEPARFFDVAQSVVLWGWKNCSKDLL